MYTCYIQSFKILDSFCRWAAWFESGLVENRRRHVFAWYGSYTSWTYLLRIKRNVCEDCRTVTGFITFWNTTYRSVNLRYSSQSIVSNDKTNKMTCTPSEDSDQPGRMHRLICWAFSHIIKGILWQNAIAVMGQRCEKFNLLFRNLSLGCMQSYTRQYTI